MKKLLSSALLILPSLTFAKTYISTDSASSLLFYPQQSAPASVVALNTSLLPAEIGEKLVSVEVSVGQRVQKDQVLAKLDCENTELQWQIQQARTEQIANQLAFDQAELLRGNKLAQQKNIGESDLERRKTQVNNSKALLKSQQAALALAVINVDSCEVKAPFNGVITKRIASVGSMVDFGKPVVEIVDTENLEISAQISTEDLHSFKAASQYQLAALSKTHPLSLQHIVPVIETNARSQEVRFSSKNTDNTIVAGSTGRVIWTSPTPFLPAHLLQKRSGQNGYFIVENELAKFVAVENAQEGRPIPFLGHESDVVVVDGRFGLTDGDDVEIVTEQSEVVTKANTSAENN